MSKKLKYETFNPYVYAQIPEKARVLDVGCATGLLGQRLKKEKNSQFLAGIEADPELASEAEKCYDKVIVTNLEGLTPLPFEEESFEIIVCADVLEHLKDPLEVLRKLSRYLKKNGFFLISVPNIAFVTIRLNLLFGRFDYNQKGGLLDSSHLRFFTRNSLRKMLKDADLGIDFVRGYNLVRPEFWFLKILEKISPTLFSLQFLAKARKRS